MSFEDSFRCYDEIKDNLKFYGISSVRMKIMISLADGPKKTKQLRELAGIQSSTILHGISELERQKIVLREGDNFYLSEIGQILTLKLTDIIKTLAALKNNQNLWLDHQINTIPKDLLKEFGDLSNSMLVESNNVNISKVHENHIEIVLKSRDIKGVSPIFYPIYSEIFKGIIEKGIKVELILTDEVLKKTIDSLEHGRKDIKKHLSTGNLILWTINDVKAAFTVTDKFLTLGLFFSDGRYDSNKNLVSNDDNAIKWANKLFEYYRKRAERFEIP
jgi:predicted transcriptional regulator